MITSLTVVAPRTVVDRGALFPKGQLEKFEAVTGIRKTRRWEGTATELAMQALVEHDTVNEVDALVVVTQSPDRKSPCMAAELHRFLSLPASVPAFDVNQSCDGFVYGVDIARRFATAGRALLVCVDMLRASDTTLDSLLFSDAAAVATIKFGQIGMPRQAGYYTDGSCAGALCADRNGLLKMDGPAVFDFVTGRVPVFIRSYEAANGASPDWVLCQHQANMSMMRLVEKRAGFSGRSLCSIEAWGNMSLCSIPAALAAEEHRILGKTVLLCGYGAGFCAAALAVDWPSQSIANIVEV